MFTYEIFNIYIYIYIYILYIYIYVKTGFSIKHGWYAIKPIAQAAGAVEYIDCFSAEGVKLPPQWVSWIWH